LGSGLPATAGIGLPGAIPIGRTTIVHYGPSTVIRDPMVNEFVSPVAGINVVDPYWGIGGMESPGYAY